MLTPWRRTSSLDGRHCRWGSRGTWLKGSAEQVDTGNKSERKACGLGC
jgi:hypothetical protein